jgi:dolichol kinase
MKNPLKKRTTHQHPSLNNGLRGVTQDPSKTNSQLHVIEHDYRVEVIRKTVHLFSLSIPIVYYFLNRSTALTILIPMTAVFLIVDIARYYNQSVEQFVNTFFGFMMRKRENDKKRKTLNGATYVLISATICVLLFPKIITIISFTILIISDITSALVGRRFGKHKFIAKSLEGSTAFFVSAIIVILLTPKINYQFMEYVIGVISALIGTIAEALPADIDDNLSVPLSVGSTLWLLYYLLLPTLNIYQLG